MEEQQPSASPGTEGTRQSGCAMQSALTDACPVPGPDLGSWVHQAHPGLWMLTMGGRGCTGGVHRGEAPSPALYGSATPFPGGCRFRMEAGLPQAGSMGTDQLTCLIRDTVSGACSSWEGLGVISTSIHKLGGLDLGVCWGGGGARAWGMDGMSVGQL